MDLSFVVPTLDEAPSLRATVEPLADRLDPAREEVVVVDGGSRDGTPDLARALGVRVIASERGRARQMNAGARAARGRVLVFLHADTRVPPRALHELRGLIARRDLRWGFFPVKLDAPGCALRVIEVGIRLRVAAGGAATGDQAIFVRRDDFLALGGYPDLPLMEDVTLARDLAGLFAPVVATNPVFTSARRWTRRGIARTQLRMWALRLAWRFGVEPARLAAHYPVVR